MKIGVRTGCLKCDWSEALDMAFRLGFDSLEPNLTADYRDCPVWDAAGRDALKQKISETGCTLDSMCFGAFWKMSPASRDAAVRREAIELMKQGARYAAELGTKWMLMPITPGEEDVSYEDSVSRWIAAAAEAAPVAEEAGVILCLENVGRGCGKSADEIQRLVEGVASPAVQAYYDIGNAIAFGNDPVAEIQQLADMISIVHIKDHANLLGEGDVPIADCIAALKGIGYNGSLVLETVPTDDPQAAACFNRGFLCGLLSQT